VSRLKLFKVATQIRQYKNRVILYLPSAYPFNYLLWKLTERLYIQYCSDRVEFPVLNQNNPLASSFPRRRESSNKTFRAADNTAMLSRFAG
jgi:hypothetical protein